MKKKIAKKNLDAFIADIPPTNEKKLKQLKGGNLRKRVKSLSLNLQLINQEITLEATSGVKKTEEGIYKQSIVAFDY